MPYSVPDDKSPNQTLPADWTDDVREDILWLAALGCLAQVQDANDRTTTSATFVNVHASALDLVVTTYGNPIVVVFCGVLTLGGNTYLDFTIDGARQGGANGILGSGLGTAHPVTLVWPVLTLAAGAHTLRPQWRTAAGTATWNGATHAPTRFLVFGG